MFSKSKINDPIEGKTEEARSSGGASPAPASSSGASSSPAPSASKPKAAPSVLSSDLKVVGNILTDGDIQIEGAVEGDIHAHLLTVGETATVKGECVADDVVVNGRVVGRVRGIKVRLTSTARVEGDIIHKTIAIESGAHFEGSVRRDEDPLNDAAKKPRTGGGGQSSGGQSSGGGASSGSGGSASSGGSSSGGSSSGGGSGGSSGQQS